MLLLTLVAALCIAACGGSNAASSSKSASSSSKSASSKNTAATTTTGKGSGRSAFIACLRQHGVTLPRGRGRFGARSGTSTTGPPPAAAPGGGFNGTPPAGAPPTGGGGEFFGRGNPRGFLAGNSKLAKAFRACGSKLGAGRFGPGRFGGPGGAHARPGFSAAALKSYVACVRRNGYPQMPEPNTSGRAPVFPSSVAKNARFQAASAKCVSILRQDFRARAGGAPPVSTKTSTT